MRGGLACREVAGWVLETPQDKHTYHPEGKGREHTTYPAHQTPTQPMHNPRTTHSHPVAQAPQPPACAHTPRPLPRAPGLCLVLLVSSSTPACPTRGYTRPPAHLLGRVRTGRVRLPGGHAPLPPLAPARPPVVPACGGQLSPAGRGAAGV